MGKIMKVILKCGKPIMLYAIDGQSIVTTCTNEVIFDDNEASINMSQTKYKHRFHEPFPKYEGIEIYSMDWFKDDIKI
jgi:hypothetical protein